MFLSSARVSSSPRPPPQLVTARICSRNGARLAEVNELAARRTGPFAVAQREREREPPQGAKISSCALCDDYDDDEQDHYCCSLKSIATPRTVTATRRRRLVRENVPSGRALRVAQCVCV